MKVDDISGRLRSALRRKSGSDDLSNIEFRRVIDVKQYITNEETGNREEVTRRVVKIISAGTGSKRNYVTLVPMKSLSLEDFTFPFSNSTKIREALKLQVLPFSAAGNVDIFPVTQIGRAHV